MSGDFQDWSNEPPEPRHKAPEPTYHWLEKKRGNRIRLTIKWLAFIAILLYFILHGMKVIR